MHKEYFETVKSLTELAGPSGFEKEVAVWLEKRLAHLNYEIRHDALGNLTFFRKSNRNKAPTLAFFAHMDEVGYLVKEICSDGTLRGYGLGGINPEILPSTRVRLVTATGSVYHGMIRAVPPHLKSALAPSGETVFDFGFSSDEQIRKAGIALSDLIVFDEPTVTAGDCLLGKAIDDRLGCAALYETARHLSSVALDYNLAFVFTAQEEVGCRGAMTAAYGLQPDLAVVVDISPTMKEYGHRGEGILVRWADRNMVSFPRLIEFEQAFLTAHSIPYQNYISLGGTDAGVVHVSAGGIPTLTLCLVAESIHSPSTLVSCSDYEALLRALSLLGTELTAAKIAELQDHD